MSQRGKPPPKAPQLEGFHGEFASFEEEYIRNYIALADTKAAWAFTIAAGVLAYLFSENQTRGALLLPEWSVSYLLLLTAVILLVLSAFFSFLVVAPRLGAPSREGIVFFGAVAKKPTPEAYVAEVAASDEQALRRARLGHCYDVAKVCTRKFSALKKAIWLGLPAVALSLACTLLG